MIKKESSEYENILNYIRDYLKISPNSINDVSTSYENYSIDLPFRTDAVLEENGIIYFIEIRSKATIDTIARMNLLRDLWSQNENTRKNIRLVVAAKSFPEREKQIMDQLDVIMLKLPWSFKPNTKEQFVSKTHRITSDKSWKIISRLLKEKKTSIRQLSLLENVSYGWAHETVQTLIQQKIAKKDHNHVSISNTDKLLNGIAWERPIANLKTYEIQIQFSDSMHAAKEITEAFAIQDNMPVGFTSYTAATLYTGYGVRHDAVYLYLKDEHIDYFRELFESHSANDIKAIIYLPDREIFQDTQEKEGVRIVSASQTLLDLAGMGYSAMDITKEMVLMYDTI